jgi:hypothetical protein
MRLKNSRRLLIKRKLKKLKSLSARSMGFAMY